MVMLRDFSGNLNLDQSIFRVPAGDYVQALNITRDSESSGQDLVVSNIVGNQQVLYNFQPGTTNICIGAYNDNIKDRVIYFVWNNQGYHSILKYENSTRTITKILESITDTNGIDILNFQLLYKINSIDVIHNDDGDLLFFTDGYNTPAGFNIADIEGGVYPVVTDDLIRINKLPPLDALIPLYGDQDPVSNVNNFKKKLFRFRYRWVYRNGYKSTWSPISIAALPGNAYDPDIESDPSKNNQITLTVTGGGADYKAIEIAGQQSIGNLWSNWFLIDSLERDDYNIAPSTTYNYVFLNDGEYSFIDPLETDLLYSYVPDKAMAQRLVNGNVLVYGNITEGYPAVRRSDISVQITSSLIDTAGSGGSSTDPSISSSVSSTGSGCSIPLRKYFLDITIGADVAVGDKWYVKFDIPVADPDINVDVNYTAVFGDTSATVATQLRNAIAASYSNPSFPVTLLSPTVIRVATPCVVPGTIFQNVSVTAVAATPTVAAGSQATWKWNAKYRLGIIYFDKYGKTNGVISFVSNTDDPTDFSVTTPDFTVNPANSYNPQIPVINASINHIPPSWAVSYQWVRTVNRSVSYFVQIGTVDVQDDSDYYYFCIEGLYKFKEVNTGFVPSYTFQEGDRLRVLAQIDTAGEHYLDTIFTDDFEIIGTAEREIVTGTNGTYLKVKKNATVFSADTYMIEVYRPFSRTSDAETVFYEFGQQYPIYIDSGTGIHYHQGQIQNQTASQPATFTFTDGDVYYKFRPEYESGDFDDFVVLGVMDANYSDYWASAVNSNGRPVVIDVNAATVTNPVLVRFGQAYQVGTNINGLNIFYPNNFDEYFRDYGAIMKLSIRDKLLHVYQKLKVGRVPIYGQILKDQQGTESVVVSDQLLNTIQYYAGDYGIGDHPECFGSNNYADYFLSNIRGIICRLSQDGITPISIQTNLNNFAVQEIGSRDFNYKIYGCFHSYNNLYIIALAETPTSPAKTLVWNEQRNGFESFLSYIPEMMCSLNNLLITFKNGQLYTHDSTTYNNFYGVQYDSSITQPFNDNLIEKKTWTSVMEMANQKWTCPLIYTDMMSYGTTRQESNLVANDFELLENQYHAAILKDANSIGGVINGDSLKGSLMVATFKATNPTVLATLNVVKVDYIDSPLTTR